MNRTAPRMPKVLVFACEGCEACDAVLELLNSARVEVDRRCRDVSDVEMQELEAWSKGTARDPDQPSKIKHPVVSARSLKNAFVARPAGLVFQLLVPRPSDGETVGDVLRGAIRRRA